MKEISKEQMDYLIKNGYVKCEKGRYPDITTCNRQGNARKKTRYVNEFIYNKYIKGREQ